MAIDTSKAYRQITIVAPKKLTAADGVINGVLKRQTEPITIAADSHFRSGALPPGFAWAAGAPFSGAPSTMNLSIQNDYGGFAQSSTLHFLYKSVSTFLFKQIAARVGIIHSASVGLRLDDGTDNNYTEFYLTNHSSGAVIFRFATRAGGGARATTDLFTAPPHLYYPIELYCHNYLTHQDFARIYREDGFDINVTSNAGASWSVARAGILINRDNTGGHALVDWVYNNFT